MPVYNVTVDDSSPMIIYSPGWIDSNPSDSQLSRYSGGTFHATGIQGANASFSFFGNAVYLFGAMRGGYGPFAVSLDGQRISGDTTASGNELFQRLLFARTGIPNGEHTVELVNNGAGTFLDLDFITFTTGDGNSTIQLGNSTMDDTVPQIIYKPATSAWDTTSSLKSSYYNASFHESQVQGAQVIIPFAGDAVSVYGSTSQNHGTFNVRIDDRDAVQLNGSAPTFRPQTLLYWAGGIGPGQHQLEVTNTQDQLYVDFDFLVTTSWTPLALSSQEKHSRSKTPIIAGVISGTCVGIAWIVALFFLLRRRRRRRNSSTADVAEGKPEPFILPPDPAVADGSHRPGEYAFGNVTSGKALLHRSQAAPTSMYSGTRASTPSSYQPRTETRSPDSRALISNPGGPSSSSQLLVPSRAAVLSASESSSSKGASSTAPPMALSDSRPSISITELSASRMNVPNRPQDWGPVIPSQDEHEEGLPPDYQQATQPMPSVTAATQLPTERPNV